MYTYQIHTLVINEADTNRIERSNKKFNTPFSILCRTTGEEINKDMSELISTINQLDFAEIHETLYSMTAEYKPFQVHM